MMIKYSPKWGVKTETSSLLRCTAVHCWVVLVRSR